mgnify:FL=1
MTEPMTVSEMAYRMVELPERKSVDSSPVKLWVRKDSEDYLVGLQGFRYDESENVLYLSGAVAMEDK